MRQSGDFRATIDQHLNRVIRTPPLNTSTLSTALERVRADPAYRVLSRIVSPVPDASVQGVGETVCVAVIDLETTGMDSSTDQVIEIAMVVCDVCRATGAIKRLVTELSSLNDPGVPIPPSATAVNGITDAMVMGQRIDFNALNVCLIGVDLVIAHNAAFDRPFAEILHRPFDENSWACSFKEIDWSAEGIESRKLDYIAFKLGFFYDAHRALADCHAVFAVLAAPLPKSHQAGFLQLFSSMQQPSYTFAALDAAFDKKDLLKTRGYAWNADKKHWHTSVFGKQIAKDELQWLAEHVYTGKSQASIYKLTATDRYSVRRGAKIR